MYTASPPATTMWPPCSAPLGIRGMGPLPCEAPCLCLPPLPWLPQATAPVSHHAAQVPSEPQVLMCLHIPSYL